jgi:hypothetical protein
MWTPSAEMLVAVAVLIAVAIAIGTLAARLFVAASRAQVGAAGLDEDL